MEKWADMQMTASEPGAIRKMQNLAFLPNPEPIMIWVEDFLMLLLSFSLLFSLRTFSILKLSELNLHVAAS